MPTTTIRSLQGSEHCDWQDTTWLWLGKEGRDGEFLGSPDRELRRFLRTTYAAHAEVPSDAWDTGFSRAGRRLWVAADGDGRLPRRSRRRRRTMAGVEGADQMRLIRAAR